MKTLIRLMGLNRAGMLLAFTLGTMTAARAEVQTNILYGTATGEKLLLDASVPDGPGPFPAVILVHGGAWTAGDKSGGSNKGYMVPMQEPLVSGGFAWFSINYRLAPAHRYPACIEDVETAIRWLKAHAAEYHVDPQRIALAGESAGGHLVALAAVRADATTRVAAVLAFYGPFDLGSHLTNGAPLNPNMQALFGRQTYDRKTAKLIRGASPLYCINSNLPPFLLLHGTADTRVSYQQSLDMQSRLRAAGVPCEVISIPGGQHGMLRWLQLSPDYQIRVVDWLKHTLKSEP